MSIQFCENYAPGVDFLITADELLFSAKSEFQRIDVYKSKAFGRFLVVDGYLMLTEMDEFIYHEMITHVPMAVRPGIKNVLVIGGGDGGTLRELLRYPTIAHIDLVEIDSMVVDVCREYLPFTACKMNDSRVTIHYEDGLEYVRRFRGAYDLIVVDSTDPIGPGESLFTTEFYQNCYNALDGDGIMVNQHESPFYAEDAAAMIAIHRKVSGVFPVSLLYQAHIPSYPSGHWLFGFASRRLHPVNDHDAAGWDALGMKLRYYNSGLHTGAFALPTYVCELLREAQEPGV